MNDSQLTNGYIANWKNHLLNYGKQNKLINNPIPKNPESTRSLLLLEKGGTSELWDIFTSDSDKQKYLEFNYAPFFDYTIDNALSDDNDKAIQNVNNNHLFQNGVRTNQTTVSALKTMLRLMKNARDFSENKGLNALFLSFGFLKWQEADNSEISFRAPLILVPVELSQSNVSAPIVLSRHDDEIICNETLFQKLNNDYGFNIPHYKEGWELDYYFDLVKNACNGKEWIIENAAAQLSMFTYLKMPMYADITKNQELIARNPIISAIIGSTNSLDDDTWVQARDIVNYDHDSTDVSEIYQILDADSSQMDAIRLAKLGKSFVLEGPPGTGKSQTITNIIAELLALNKKVLFVSEKAAALHVVYDRLTKCGLQDFCLSLHDPNAKRSDILKQINDSLTEANKLQQLSEKASPIIYNLKVGRDALNQYANEVNTVIAPLNKSIFQVNGEIAKLENYNKISYTQNHALEYTLGDLFAREQIITSIANIVEHDGYMEDSIWKNTALR